MDFLTTALQNLPVVATSRAAFVGYLLVVTSWLVISLRVRRNRQLLQSLEKLPERDRLEALRLEMGVVSLKGGLSPQEWIRSRIHLYLFVGFCILAILVVVLVAMSFFGEAAGTASADVTVYSPGEKLHPSGSTSDTTDSSSFATLLVDNSYDGSGVRYHGAGDPSEISEPSPLLRLTYDYVRVAEGIIITPAMPYLDLLKRGGPVLNVGDLLLWQFPKLAVKVLNNSPLTLLVTEIAVRVDSSIIDLEPVIRVSYAANGSVPFTNDGWGAVREARVRFDVRKADACDPDNERQDTTLPFEVRLGTFRQSAELPFEKYVSRDRLQKLARASKQGEDDPCDVCVPGIIRYSTDHGDERQLRFLSVQNLCGVGGGELAEIYYDLFLKAGEQGYTKLLPISHSLKPGEAEQLVVRVATDKSARFDLSFSLRGAGGVSIPTDRLQLNIFRPRSATGNRDVKFRHTGARWRAGP
jgi:hypothetical protein